MSISFENAKTLLSQCVRHELRDHAFGDAEITWVNARNQVVAFCYLGGGTSGGVSVNKPGYENVTIGEFDGKEAAELRRCGTLRVERNDSTGPDVFRPGECLPGLTLKGVWKELTGTEFPEED